MRSSAVERVRARLLDERVVGREELVEAQGAGVADHRHHQRPRAVLALDVDREAEVDARRRGRGAGLPSISAKWSAMTGMLGRGAGDRVRDQVRERDLRAGLLELPAAGVERRRRRSCGSSSRSGSRGSRPCSGRASPRRPCITVDGRARPRGRAALRGGGEHVGLDDPARRAAAGDRAEVDARAPRRRGARPARRWRRSPAGAAPRRAVGGGRGGGRAGRAARRRRPSPAVAMRPITWPTVTVSPSRGEELGDRARCGRGQLDVDLVGRDLDDGVAGA